MISLSNYMGEVTGKIIKLVNGKRHQINTVNNEPIDCSYQDFVEYGTCDFDVKVKTLKEKSQGAGGILKNNNGISCSYQDYIEYETCNFDKKIKTIDEADKSKSSGFKNNKNIDCCYQEFVEYDTCNWGGNIK